MLDVLSFFTEDKISYAANGIIVYDFDDSRKNEFILHVADFYRRAFISDEDLEDNVTNLGTTRKQEIEAVVPTNPSIMSGDFGEILSYVIFTQLHSMYNIAPLRWRWKEERDRAVHFTDMMILCCPDENNPQTDDKMMTLEVKTRATKPGTDKSSINEAVEGALKDSVSRGGKTLLFMQQKFKIEKNYDAVRKVKRFEESVATPYEEYHNAVAIVEREFLSSHHIANLDNETLKKVTDYNSIGNPLNKYMSVFVVPIAELKSVYESLYYTVKNS